MDKKYPDWVMKCKKEGTAIHKIGNNFYLYKIASEWDKKMKRPRKITKGYLGKITIDGLKEPGYKINTPTSCKEYGAVFFLMEDNKDIIERLKECFPYLWREIFSLSVFRLMYQSPLKHMELHYQDSWLQEEFKRVNLSKNTLHQILEDVGRNRTKIIEFLRYFIHEGENLLIDLTHIFSLGKDMLLNDIGYNKQGDFTPQMNLLFIFSFDQKLPLFYRVLHGNVRDVSSLSATIEESRIKNVVHWNIKS